MFWPAQGFMTVKAIAIIMYSGPISYGVVIICAADGEAVDVHSPSGLAQLREAVGRAALTMAI